MEQFTFKGNWEDTIQLPAFAGFQSRGGAYTSKDSQEPSDGTLELIFEDDLSETPDPYPEQIAAINYILKHQQEIVEAILHKISQDLPALLLDWGLNEEPEFKDVSPNALLNLMGFSTLRIMIPHKDGLAYFEFDGGCEWDEEHGLNVLMHKNRVLTFGGIDGTSFWSAVEDNGTKQEKSEKYQREVSEKKLPKRYKPHPKYGVLKPSHEYANETYEIDLINGKFNEVFITEVEAGTIDLHGRWTSQEKTWLEAACWYKNNELAIWLFEKGVELRYALQECVSYNRNYAGLKLLIEKGGNINAQDKLGETALFIVAKDLANEYGAIANSNNSEIAVDEESNQRIAELENLIRWMLERGANPSIKNRYKDNLIGFSEKLQPEQKQRFLRLFEGYWQKEERKRGKGDLASKEDKPWWKFW